MTDIQAAIGIVQMKRLSEILKQRNELAHIYNNLLMEAIFESKNMSEKKNK